MLSTFYSNIHYDLALQFSLTSQSTNVLIAHTSPVSQIFSCFSNTVATRTCALPCLFSFLPAWNFLLKIFLWLHLRTFIKCHLMKSFLTTLSENTLLPILHYHPLLCFILLQSTYLQPTYIMFYSCVPLSVQFVYLSSPTRTMPRE